MISCLRANVRIHQKFQRDLFSMNHPAVQDKSCPERERGEGGQGLWGGVSTLLIDNPMWLQHRQVWCLRIRNDRVLVVHNVQQRWLKMSRKWTASPSVLKVSMLAADAYPGTMG